MSRRFGVPVVKPLRRRLPHLASSALLPRSMVSANECMSTAMVSLKLRARLQPLSHPARARSIRASRATPLSAALDKPIQVSIPSRNATPILISATFLVCFCAATFSTRNLVSCFGKQLPGHVSPIGLIVRSNLLSRGVEGRRKIVQQVSHIFDTDAHAHKTF